ncbi:DUF3408 domain-containing protein [Parabacteroides sp. OttesenSCG-928-K15]|nr:DUF3408 domain-containing protein [Parabacteroides sp. OttesenSCG-928-K15]
MSNGKSKIADTSGIDVAGVIGNSKKKNRENPPTPVPEKVQVPEPPQEVADTEPVKEKEVPKRKRSQTASYKETFVKRNEMKLRQCVYISHEVHSVITKLVRALADIGNDITVGGYIDTVLNEHLQLHKEEINEVYRQRQNDLL